MVSILSWNIQNGLGVDGTRSLDRIAQIIGEHDSPDVICLQEVSRGIKFDSSTAPDQVEELATLLSAYAPYFGPAYDILPPGADARAQYGNMVLSKLPILSAFNHALPQPPRNKKKQMPRQATEVTVMCDDGPLRIITSHLEFHSKGQRHAQMAAIKSIHTNACEIDANPPKTTNEGPYQPIVRAARAVICGDFNCSPESEELALLTGIPITATSGLIDSWQALHPDEPHPPTCGIFDHKQWPEGPHCRDYFVVSESLVGALDSVSANTETNASDHQPILLTLRTR